MRRAGFTLVELMTGMGILATTVLAIFTLLIAGLRSFAKTTMDTDISQQNALGMRRITETIRSSATLSISSDGTRVTYTLPQRAGFVDELTGEKEYVIPIASDGVTRYFQASGGKIVDQTGRVLVRSVALRDPEPTSSQYNQVYAPFQSTTIGSRRAVTVNLITEGQVNGAKRWSRMKSTVLIRNTQ